MGESAPHKLFGQVLVVFVKERHFARIEEFHRVEVLCRFLGERAKELRGRRLHAELHKVRAHGGPAQSDALRTAYPQETLKCEERVAAEPREERVHIAAERDKRIRRRARMPRRVACLCETRRGIFHEIGIARLLAQDAAHPL